VTKHVTDWTITYILGLEPEGGEIAAIDGFALRIGQRAALVPTPGAKVYGLVFSLTRSELGEELETA
jgi:hypothetical protein